ncbi:M15 family metallopeptidase [Bacillus sp. APMAM]|nr:M15 family metallopeptidase [Bacillus sp. APMAM]RTZ54188.1 D-alanyl-D-alanine carboxypeptidase family protein [Bacillus sp. SAJ1]
MKKWGFIFILIMCLVIFIMKWGPFDQDKRDSSYHNESVEKGSSNKEVEKSSFEQITITKIQVYRGNLLLVNSQYPVHKDSVKSDIVKLNNRKDLVNGFVLNGPIYLSEGIDQKFSEMVKDAAKVGVNHFIINSGYRGFDEQESLYKSMGSDYALPAGYSEHNLGLSLDVGSTQQKMEQAPEGKWIQENSWKYGFILRYPPDKADITGIHYEPWHIRYVGLPHSKIMYEKNFTLEEYLAYIKKHKEISTSVDGKQYTISYYPVSKNISIQIPKNHGVDISGNNVDGVIVTITK